MNAYYMKQRFLAVLRIALGWVFLWAFLDKLFGLGFATCRSKDTGAIDVLCNSAWLSGGSPTTGFLTYGTKGPLASLFQSLAGSGIVDGLFMIGLLGIGLALILGIGMRLATYAGVAMMLLMYAALLLPENNPLIDDHIVYALALIVLYTQGAGNAWGLGEWWQKRRLVKKVPLLK